MLNLKCWLNLATNPQDFIWVEAILIKEMPKAILVKFDGKQIWFPKTWIVRIRRSKANSNLKIKISLAYWAGKSQ
ncbi:hypothetical protein ACFL1I_08630 [Candidatus Omnitrophota bacterium]